MFGKGKGSSHEKDELLPPAPQLQEFDACKFGRARFNKFNRNLMHRSRHDSCW